MYILAIDQGTSSTRAVIFNFYGQLIQQASVTFKQYYPYPGWVEHDPEEIWNSVLQSIRTVCSGIDAKKILACGITNQRETTVCWDKNTHQCFGFAIVWQDRRTQAWCDQFKSKTDFIQSKTGLRCDPYFSASKLKWLLTQYKDSLHSNNLAFGTMDSFLLWRLTQGQVHKTDVSNASRTLLFNIHTQSWDTELLDLFQIPLNVLPEVCDSDAHFGYLSADILGHEIPILSVLGDQQSALLGLGCTQRGDVKITYGTGGFLMLNAGLNCPDVNNGLLKTMGYRIQKHSVYAIEGSIYDAGSALKWLKNSLRLFQRYDEIPDLVSRIPSNEGVYFIPAFSGLGVPHWMPEAGAMFVGLSRASTRSHLVRAVLESIVFQTQDLLVLIQDLGVTLSDFKVDGGMIENLWFLKFLADLIGLNIHVPEIHENTAKGVAMIAYLSLGFESDLAKLAKSWQNFYIIETELQTVYQEYYHTWLREIQKIKLYHSLKD